MGELGHKIREFADALETMSLAEAQTLGESLGELTAVQRTFLHRTLDDVRLGREIPAHELSLLECLLEDWERQNLVVKLAFIAQVKQLACTEGWPDDVLSAHPAINDIMRPVVRANLSREPCVATVNCAEESTGEPDSAGCEWQH